MAEKAQKYLEIQLKNQPVVNRYEQTISDIEMDLTDVVKGKAIKGIANASDMTEEQKAEFKQVAKQVSGVRNTPEYSAALRSCKSLYLFIPRIFSSFPFG